MKNKPKETVLVLPDIQAPFQHKDTLDFIDAVEKRVKATTRVCLGDETDQHALGDWDKDPDGYSAGHELTAALAFMKQLYERYPVMLVCTSNHGARVFRKAFKAGIPRAYLRDYKDFMQAPKGWVWADYFVVDNIRYEHGEGFSGKDGAIKAAMGNMRSTVIGHIHAHAGIQFYANEDVLIFGFNAGSLVDHQAYALAYQRKFKAKPIVGVGIVDKGIPRYIPMVLNKKGRWVGKL